MIKNRFIPATLFAILSFTAILNGCGQRSEQAQIPGKKTRFTVMLDYLPNADHAGLYAAQQAQLFQKAGLDVQFQTPTDPATPLKLLAAGKIDLAISYQPELLLARAKGQRIVSVGALIQTPLTSLISLGDKAITNPKELVGKRVGTAGIPYQTAYLKTILATAGIKSEAVRETNVGFNLVPAMLSKKVDATLGAFWNVEGVELARRKKQPTILKMDQLGVPTYNELVLVARQESLGKNGALYRRFMQALSDSHQLLRKDPERWTKPLLEANPDLDAKSTLASVQATLPAFFPSDTRKPFGFQNQMDWKKYAEWMAREQLIPTAVGSHRSVTNEFLPGQGI